jgi:hypothetical protein
MFTNFKNNFYYTALVLCAYIVYTFFIGSLINLFGFTLNKYNCNGANIIFVASVAVYLLKKHPANVLAIALQILASLAISFSIAIFFLDIGYDGQAYHIPAVDELAGAWNPIYNVPLKYADVSVFLKGFAKAAWYANAHIYASTGAIQAAKATNIIMAIACLGIAFKLCSLFLKNNWYSFFMATLATFNPFFLNLFLSNSNDSQVLFSIYILIFLLIIYLKQPSKYLLYFICVVVIYAVNTKITLPIYLVIFGFGLLIYLWLNKQFKNNYSLLIKLSISLIIGVFIFGYPTYVRNVVDNGHPFYPLYNHPTLKGVFALDYSSGNSVVNFGKSIFAKTNFGAAITGHIQYKFPFLVSKYELERYGFCGVMVGGFGPWLSALFLFFIVAMVIQIKQFYTKPFYKNILVLMGIILLSTLINPHAYIARYNPQFYLLFVIYLFNQLYFGGAIKIFDKLYTIILMLNTFLVCGYIVHNFNSTVRRKNELKNMAASGKPIEVFWGGHKSQKLYFKSNVNFIEIDSLNTKQVYDSIYQSTVKYRFLNTAY